MKTITIHKGHHYPCNLLYEPIKGLGISFRNKQYTVTRKITFNPDCCYSIDGNDQFDWSKLFGFKFGIFGIHRNSVRFGWRYNPKTNLIEISRILYYRNPDSHIMEHLTSVKVGTEHTYSITHTISGKLITVKMKIDGEEWITSFHSPNVRLRIGSGFYFGGNQKAPQTVSIKIN